MQFMEKELWMIKCVKCGLQSFVLVISHWRPMDVDNDQIKIFYNAGDSQHIWNDILIKPWKSFTPAYVSCFNVWLQYKQKQLMEP